ncbi:BolA family protein [Croceicoccus sp. F390]|uniref:BolA family protein n=1 Tax=Croceicoccus esteveae TaxID=3075597 RepID=A0ABU2ZHP9_9SPHN|nr:BolA family protein [Croceicoccus sp. F390]MDT0575583.1 BolA family protein [Croceicoccus sp. F390]
MTLRFLRKSPGMNAYEQAPGTIAAEIENRLVAALSPARLVVTNDSAAHSGHTGDDGTGESHFSILIEAESLAGLSRLDRQRAVNRALGDLPGERVHAMAIRAGAPGEFS